MKHFLLYLFFLLTPVFLFSQTIPRTMVVLEISTGTWCQYCPGAAIGADQLLSGGANVAIIEYHNGDPYANTASNARNTYYNVPGYPNDQFDGPNTTGVGGALCGSGNTYSSYHNMYNTRIAVPSPLYVDISGTNSGNNYNIVLSIHKTAPVTGSNIKAFLVLTETNIATSGPWPANGQCMNEVDFVERTMVPNENGTAVTFDDGDFQVVNLSFTKDPSWVAANCELVAFVQDYGTKEIYNGNKVALNSLQPPVSVSYTGAPTTGCAPVTVNYTSTVSAGVNTYQWSFPGGTPSTSSAANPSVSYTTAGTYNATLTAWNSTNNRGNKLSNANYLTITSAPATPVQPTGNSGLCVNPPDQPYVTISVPSANTYTWELLPSGAGVVTPSGTSCSVNWDNAFTGTATLKVKATNSCGDGPWSTPLSITLSPMPGTPATPTGPTTLCVNPPNTIYTSTGTSPASAYTWELIPSTAGTLSTNWTTVTVDWNDTFTGTAQLHLSATNNGCDGPWSAFLNINVVSGPAQYTVTGGGTFCATTGSGIAIGLSGSEPQTNYTLYRDGTATSTVVPGTGSVITFGNQTAAGTYTVHATNTSTTCSSVMNGSGVINVDPEAPGTPGTPAGPEQPNAGTNSNYTTSGGTYATSYSWSVSPSNAGSVIGSTTTGTVSWNVDFTGVATVKVKGLNSCGSGAYSNEFTVTVLPATGINDQQAQKRIVISPNPASGSVTITPASAQKADLKVYNSLGRMVIDKPGLQLDGKYLLDISTLTPGIYLFMLTGTTGNQVEKIVVTD